jgi:amiloride-sensitive sodium channel
MAGCLFMITEIYTKFLNSPVVVTFATHDTAIYEVPFPAVTICPEAKTSGVKFKYSDVFNKIMKENQTLTKTEYAELHAYLSGYLLRILQISVSSLYDFAL